MTDRPILFSGPMVNAILEGRKTQTRRVLKPQPVILEKPMIIGGLQYFYAWLFKKHGPTVYGGDEVDLARRIIHAGTRFKVGDRLYVREAWSTSQMLDPVAPRNISKSQSILYLADYEGYRLGKFRQGMHMPRWASRLTLVVTDVRVQRLQEISKDDALTEGVHPDEQNWAPGRIYAENMPAHLFGMLWDSINEPRGFGWDVNPWVVAVTFETHKCNIDQMEATDE